MTEQHIKCSFCGRKGSELGDDKLINGQEREVAAICSSCVKLCLNLIQEHECLAKNTTLDLKIPKPTEIKDHLDEYIIGQNDAKIVLSVAVCDHYKRVVHNAEKPKKGKKKVRLEKSNLLLIGPTGTGKTQIARSIANYLGVPFAIGDATSLTEAGYVGDDVENLLLRLIQAADGDIEKAQNGILFIDEIDKLASTSSSRSTSKDVGGEGVQQALLKMLEGTVCHVSPKGGRKHPEGNVVEFDTSNVLFVGSGAFVGLEEVVSERVENKCQLGFDIQAEQQPSLPVNSNIEPEDLVRYGLIPELVGRLPILARLEELSKEALRKIFVDIKDSLYEQYKVQFQIDGIELEITDSAIDEIVAEAIALKTGARGLRAVAEKMILPYKYRISSFVEDGVCVIDGHLIEGDFSRDKNKQSKAG